MSDNGVCLITDTIYFFKFDDCYMYVQQHVLAQLLYNHVMMSCDGRQSGCMRVSLHHTGLRDSCRPPFT